MSSLLTSIRESNVDAKYLIAASALVNFAGGYFMVARPVYLYAAGISPTMIGILISVQSFLGVVFGIPIAMLSDTLGRKRFVVFGLLLDAAGSFIYFSSLNIILLVVAQIFFGIVVASASSPFLALFTEKTTSENRNSMFVILSFISGVSTGAGNFLSGLPATIAKLFDLGQVDSFRPLFLASSVASLIAAFLVAKKVSETRRKGEIGSSGGNSLRGLFKIPRKSLGTVKKFSVVGLIGFGAGLIIPLFPLWYNLRFGVGVSVIGPLFGSMMLITSIASLFTPAMVKKTNTILTIVMTQASSVILLVLVPLSPNYLLAGTVMVARSVLMNMSGPVQQSFTMSLVHPDERATATSIIQLFDSIPRAYAPTIGGYLFSVGSLDLPFFVTAALYLTSTTLFYLLFRKARPLPEGRQVNA
ncbi:MAG: MFS transporter [Nitrososphaerota archaeon]|nr:MFS transporter [Nitrososphaerota archaeon]MDG7023394.1 MFS transporter [Nitrososphaerota archaeon]